MARKRLSQNKLLGLGLDNRDDHKRITKGDDFRLIGGSAETHEKMVKTVIKTVEDLGRKGKTIANADPEELSDLIRKHESNT